MRLNGGVIYALSRWEGGMWIAGILPFAAFALLDPMSAKVEPIG